MYLEEAATVKEATNKCDNLSTLVEDLVVVGMHDQVKISLAVSDFL